MSKNKKNNGQFNNKTLTHLIKNFYMTNPITRASVTMAKCSKELTIEEENV